MSAVKWWSRMVGIGLAAFAAVAFAVAPIVCFLLAIWLGDERWGWTGAVLSVPAVILLFGWVDSL